MNQKKYVIGLDYGSDSMRALLVDVHSGEEICSEVQEYPRWKKGLFCKPDSNQFRQHPLDYLDSLEACLRKMAAKLDGDMLKHVIALGLDTTGSTPVAVDKEGVALSLKPAFCENPNAMFVLWKDHAAIPEAEAINQEARRKGGVDYTDYSGGIYSSEWFWSKALHVINEDKDVAADVYTFVEHCDWLPMVLSNDTNLGNLKRSRCALGHKALWHAAWGGLPPKDFFDRLNPQLGTIRETLSDECFTSDVAAGHLSDQWAQRLGLPANIPITVGAFDCHMGAVAAGIKPGVMTKIMGTSTCDMVVSDYETLKDLKVKGICGQVDGSILPGKIGLEAGQSAFGDLYAWFKNMPPQKNLWVNLGVGSAPKQ